MNTMKKHRNIYTWELYLSRMHLWIFVRQCPDIKRASEVKNWECEGLLPQNQLDIINGQAHRRILMVNRKLKMSCWKCPLKCPKCGKNVRSEVRPWQEVWLRKKTSQLLSKLMMKFRDEKLQPKWFRQVGSFRLSKSITLLLGSRKSANASTSESEPLLSAWKFWNATLL